MVETQTKLVRPLFQKAVIQVASREWRISPMRCKGGPSPERGADRSDLGIFGEGKCVFHIDAEIADCVLDLTMAEQELDSAQVAGCPVDN